MRTFFIFCVLAAFVALPAAASTITWDFSTGGDSNWTFEQDGASVTAEAWVLDNNLFKKAGSVVRFDSELSVCHGTDCSKSDEKFIGPSEFMLFRFAPVASSSISVHQAGIDHNGLQYYVGAVSNLGALGDKSPVDLGLTLVNSLKGDQFDYTLTGKSISALLIGLPAGGNPSTGFRVISMAADPVPEPAAFILLGSGLAGLGLVRRFRRG